MGPAGLKDTHSAEPPNIKESRGEGLGKADAPLSFAGAPSVNPKFVKVVKSARRGKALSKRLRRHIVWVFIGFFVLFLGASLLVWQQEHEMQGPFTDSMWTVLFTLVGQGEFATSPRTVVGRITVFFISIVGVALLGVIFSEIIQRLMSSKLREMMGMSRCKYVGHTVICGWSERARLILKELDAIGQEAAVVAKERPANFPGGDVFFIAGSSTDDEILERAGIKEAAAVIILADRSGNPDDSDVDARTILIALAVESCNPKAYSVIELTHPENERHARHARVDDIIYSDSIIAEITATCALYTGISVFMHDILCASDDGHSFASFDVDPKFEGKTIAELFTEYQEKTDDLAVAVIVPPDGKPDAPLSQWHSRANPERTMNVTLPMKIVMIVKTHK